MNVLVTDPANLKTIRTSVSRRLKGKRIGPADLEEAERRWRLRRQLTQGHSGIVGRLVAALEEAAESLSIQNIHIAAYRERLSPAGQKKEKLLQKAYCEKMRLFEGWSSLPRGVPIVCLYVDKKDKVFLEDVWEVLPKDSDEDNDQKAFKRPNAGGLTIKRADAKSVWNRVEKKIRVDRGWREDGYCCLPAIKLASP